MTLQFTKHEKIRLKGHPDFSEAWLHDRICEDSSVLGLGELEVLRRERQQLSGGRLDMLLRDSLAETWYEVEIMLGATDPSHIIRCLEYWDVERRRYPAYNHVAVLIAEEITSRFSNIISLLSGTIPIVAIQVNALQVSGNILLDFVTILDQRDLRTDDVTESGGEDVDRSTWEARVGPDIMRLADRVLAIINEVSDPPLEFKYKKSHIGICSGQSFFNVAVMYPKKIHLPVQFHLEQRDEWMKRLEEGGLDCRPRGARKLALRIREADLGDQEELIREYLHAAVKENQAD